MKSFNPSKLLARDALLARLGDNHPPSMAYNKLKLGYLLIWECEEFDIDVLMWQLYQQPIT